MADKTCIQTAADTRYSALLRGPLQPFLKQYDQQNTRDEQRETEEQPLKLIDVDGVPNLRGFGGYPCTSLSASGQTRRGRLYRSAHPGYMEEAGLSRLKALGIRSIVDLTSRNEKTAPRKLPPERLEAEGIAMIHCPLEQQKSFSVQDLLQKYKVHQTSCLETASQPYVELFRDSSAELRKLMILLINHTDGAILLHCSLGKDRTGLVFALLLLLLEVSDEIVAKEYSLSTDGLRGSGDKVEKFLQEKTRDASAARSLTGEMVTARGGLMAKTIEGFRAEFGSAGEYLTQQCHLSDSEVLRLKSSLVDGHC